MSDKDGGPAFPGENHTDWTPGMSLRDWFAGQMLVGMKLSGVNGRERWFAETAYAMADAMLAARDAKEGEK